MEGGNFPIYIYESEVDLTEQCVSESILKICPREGKYVGDNITFPYMNECSSIGDSLIAH